MISKVVQIYFLDSGQTLLISDDFLVSRLPGRLSSSTHAELLAMAQEDYNLDSTESVEITNSLPVEMMLAPDTPPIHVTSDRQVEDEDEVDDDMCFEDFKKIEGGRSNGNSIYVNQSFVSKDALLSELRLTAVKFRFTFRIYKSTKNLLVTTVGDQLALRRHCTPKYVGRLFIDRVGIIDGLNPQHITYAMKNMFGMTLDYTTSYRALLYAQTLDDGEEDAGISIVAEADENGEDYSVYGKVEDEDEEDDDMCFEDIEKIEGGRSNGNSIYVNQSFVSKDALLSELRLTAVRFKFSFRIYKSTKTLLVTTCPVSGCQWKVRASVKHGTNTFWVTKYVEKHTCSVGDRLAQRRHCTPKYVGRLFIDRVRIIDGLNPQHITDAVKNMFGMTLDYTTSYRALLYAQTLIADTMMVQPIDGWRFFVKGGKMDCVVDLEHGKCDCGVYAVEKIPCSHAIAAGTSAGVEYLLAVRSEIADTMTVQPIDGWRFFVKGGKMDCVVDLKHVKCDCGVYAVEKIPCFHAIAAGTSAGLHISTLVCPVYSKDFLFAGYLENIYPCVGQQVEEHTCFPLDVKRGPGRQKKSRWQSWLKLSRMRGRKPRKQHKVYRCSKCKETDHTKPQCKSSSV
ncbi:hypothetical protein F2Q69_00005265 [Brassica cretica]|uniref:SWIM-type domain-containing protein n=1 Tax=Brassica cretica TaxID=69181 RepID=A0A8S9PHB2_BRACR|nr:hypothetical protein F2Q69_00005265 [Brassica cretica]